MKLSKYSKKQLQAELKRREKIEKEKAFPIMKYGPLDIRDLTTAVEDFTNYIKSDDFRGIGESYALKKQEIFRCAIETYYGKEYWRWLSEKVCCF